MIFDIDSLLNDELINLRKLFVSHRVDLRFVGGCVRDYLKGEQPHDIDLCTDANPDEQINIYKQNNIRYLEHGKEHGTITVIMHDVTYEITSLRLDVATDGRRATVAYTKDWLADSARRDFTINSMSLTFDGVLIDPFDGYNDLQAGIVKFVGDADQRIKEDYLRILRWFRFRGRYENPDYRIKNYHPDSKHIMTNSSGLAQISKERVWSEISKILSGPNGIQMILEIHRHCCAEPIDLPTRLDYIYIAEEMHEKTKNPLILLCSLYGFSTTLTILNKWKASNDEKDFVIWLADNKTQKLCYLLAVKGAKREWVCELADFQGLDPFDRAVIAEWPIPTFPVDGFDLIRKGIKPGPMYSEIFSQLKDYWAKTSYTATKDQLLKQVDEMVR